MELNFLLKIKLASFWGAGISREKERLKFSFLPDNIAKEESPKRNIASIARDVGFMGKRNAAALLKNDRYLSHMLNQVDSKRNLASFKATYKPRYKREMNSDYYEDDEYPNLQGVEGYEKLMEEFLEGQRAQKRFLGEQIFLV